jgi:hypothetical protein
MTPQTGRAAVARAARGSAGAAAAAILLTGFGLTGRLARQGALCGAADRVRYGVARSLVRPGTRHRQRGHPEQAPRCLQSGAPGRVPQGLRLAAKVTTSHHSAK